MTSIDGECHRSSESTKCALDELFGVLASSHRRLALHYLSKHCDGVADLKELVEFVAAESGTPDADHDTVSIDLRHNHIPKLERYGVVEYEDRNRRIRYREDELLEQWLDRVETFDLA